MALRDLTELTARVLRDTEAALSWTNGLATEVPLEEFFVEPTLTDPRGDTVRPLEAIERARGIMIVGPPGAGKTTLLRVLARRQSVSFLAGTSSRAGLFIAASKLADTSQKVHEALPILVGVALNNRYQDEEIERLVLESATTGTLSLFLDGLDEVAPSQQIIVFRAIQEARERYPHLQIVCSSRPSAIAGWPPDFLFFHIDGLTDASIASYLGRLSAENPARAHEFIETVSTRSHLARLTRNPLLLTLLWRLFISSGHLATSPALLYADVSDYLLFTWDREKGIRNRSALSIAHVHVLLEQLAIWLFESQRLALTRREALEIISSSLRPTEFSPAAAEVLEGLLTTGILLESGRDTISFVHLSFLEFYVARALAPDPRRLVTIIDKPHGHEIAVFAAGLTLDVGPLVEAALERRSLLLAAKCISNGRLENEQLAGYVVQEFRREVGDRFLSLVAETYRATAPQEFDTHSDLLTLWKLSKQPGLLPADKGKRLERFAQAFFGQFFKVVNSNLNTEDGEIDILMENTSAAPFWLECGADILVECKNWISNAPLHEVGAFGYKATRFKVRVAFFLSMTGFTEDALRSMRNQAASMGPLLVPIMGEDIERALTTRELLEEFLKERIRRIKYAQKY